MENGAVGASPLHPETPGDCLASPMMANSPLDTSITESSPKLNGATNNQTDYSSESDALVIDESAPKLKQKTKEIKEFTSPHHFNPYFHESIVELSRQHHQPPTGEKSKLGLKGRRFTKAKSPKLREYAQYLGLQPTVQFKCSKCNRAGFESLTILNEHIAKCTEEPSKEQPESSSASFKLTRKVFLCSACGTYYENWNLYVHMLEVHRRYLCLYCLGMFSVLDDLCVHIQSRHNLEPGHKDTPDDFFKEFSDPCYIECCDCGLLFNEQDNFFYHTCVVAKKSQKKPPKAQILPENHVTGDSLNQIVGDNRQDVGNCGITAETADTIDDSVNTKDVLLESDSEPDLRGFDDLGKPVFVLPKQNPPEQLDLEGEEEGEVGEKDEEEEEVDQEIEEFVDEGGMEEEECVNDQEEEPMETRKVPKLSLKLKPGSFPEIDQSFNAMINSDDEDDGDRKVQNDSAEQIESENEVNVSTDKSQENIDETVKEEEEENNDDTLEEEIDEIPVAGADVPIIALELEQPLDKFDPRILIQQCLKETAANCTYCNHARKIAVNGKQLGLHLIAEHRYSAVVHSITAEELIPESFVARIKESLARLDETFFSLDAGLSDEAVTFSHVFECFQCRYVTTVHKELYLHNRKLHAKNLLLCVMCKSNFYSYSELICHLCPGLYVLESDVQFRCCMCVCDNLPSAFRLMVHLRKRHHVCDVCLEMCHNQYKLSSHVWKHKLHHFCYRCAIAYRNKPDITRHLFWKHGTESVLCKRCLQKKWPHVYHFCVPPTSFQCDECTLSFSRAVSLKVHKRIHADERPHACTFDECQEKFVSKKLLAKHELRHREPPESMETIDPKPIPIEEDVVKVEDVEDLDKKPESPPKVVEEKKKIDVYDLPALNLSESDSSSDSDTEVKGIDDKLTEQVIETDQSHDLEISLDLDENFIEIQPDQDDNKVPDNIWDDFKNYQATKEKFDHILLEQNADASSLSQLLGSEVNNKMEEEVLTLEKALMDHDYCIDPNNKPDVSYTEVKPDLSQSVDHDYCSTATSNIMTDDKQQVNQVNDCHQSVKSAKSSSSDSSSDSCSCGPNCSCSSSSSSDSSTSDSSDSDSSTEEGRRRQQVRRNRRRTKKNTKGGATVAPPPVIDVIVDNVTVTKDAPIEESDLETTESETDEEFYDRQPQLFAKKMLEEKRNQLLAGIEASPVGGNLNSRAGTPNILPEEVATVKKKKSKSKKKKKKKSKSTSRDLTNQYYQPPITLTLSRNSPTIQIPKMELSDRDESIDGLRASKRRRVPNKFYGYSSDEEESSPAKWRPLQQQPQFHNVSMVVPPITIKTQSFQPQQARIACPPAPPKVQPFSIRTAQGQMKVQQRRMPPIRLRAPKAPPPVTVTCQSDSSMVGGADGSEDDSSGNEGRNLLQVNPDALYCYCKCPYDEVSEMIGCDSRDCDIEWFHFECVGIMVPPKGHWYCPECRKKRQQRRDLLKIKLKTTNNV